MEIFPTKFKKEAEKCLGNDKKSEMYPTKFKKEAEKCLGNDKKSEMYPTITNKETKNCLCRTKKNYIYPIITLIRVEQDKDKEIMKRKLLKCMALTATLALSAALALTKPVVAYAAVESARADETLYVNMDQSGAPTAASIVKHIYFGSEDSYTDFGDYSEVTNMSTGETLDIAGGRVTVARPDGAAAAYIEGTLDPEQVTLPFSFDVTYRLNGVVTEPEDLGGASGLIEVDITISPDPAASDYMRDNFVLMAAIPLTGDFYSIDAPGSQIAALGSYTAIVFEALPGSEAEFTARLGTDSFETTGVMFMMSPATVSDLKNVKDIKELNDKFRTDTDAMLTDMETLMDTVTTMSEELQKTNLALSELKAAKDILHGSADDIFDANANALNDIRLLAESLTPMDESLRTMEWLLYDVNREMNALDQDLLRTSDKMTALNTRLKSLGSALDGVDMITETELKNALNEIIDELKDIYGRLDSVGDDIDITEYTDELDDIILLLDETPIAEAADTASTLRDLRASLSDFSSGIEELSSVDSITKLLRQINALSEDLEDISGYAGAVSFQTARLMTSMQNITGDMDSLIMTLDSYHDDMEDALGNVDDTLLLTQRAAVDGASALTLANDTIRAASERLSAAADISIEAGEGTVDKSFDMLDNVSDLKESGQDLRLSVDEELDRLEEESSLLSMDPDAPKVSLTSTKNREPMSISIVCRTAEISAPHDEARAILDAEAAEAETTVLERLGAVFNKIFSFIAGLFS